jgi:hypothetical protein
VPTNKFILLLKHRVLMFLKKIFHMIVHEVTYNVALWI